MYRSSSLCAALTHSNSFLSYKVSKEDSTCSMATLESETFTYDDGDDSNGGEAVDVFADQGFLNSLRGSANY